MLRVSAEFTLGSRGSYTVFKITRWAKNSLGEMYVYVCFPGGNACLFSFSIKLRS